MTNGVYSYRDLIATATMEQKNSKDISEATHDLWQDFLEGLSTFKHYGRGWTNRNAHVKDTALDLV